MSEPGRPTEPAPGVSGEPPRPADPAGQPSQTTSKHRGKPSLASVLALVGIAIVAGALAGQIVFWTQGIIPPPEGFAAMPPYPPEVIAEADRAELGNAAIGFGLAGALIGAAVGGGLWVQRHAARPAIIGLIAGAVLGVVGGALNVFALRWTAEIAMDDIFRAMLINGPFAVCMGIAIGVAFAASGPRGHTGKVVTAACGAALIAAVLYPFVAFLVSKAARLEMLVPMDLGVRLIWLAFPAALIVFAAARALARPQAGAQQPAAG